MTKRKEYTTEEKVKYYTRKVLNLEFALKKAQERLHDLHAEGQRSRTAPSQKRRVG